MNRKMCSATRAHADDKSVTNGPAAVLRPAAGVPRSSLWSTTLAAILSATLLSAAASAEPPAALHPDDVKPINVAPGVLLKELTGRSGPPGANTRQSSVAFFHLEPGRASAWSYTKVGEESFFVLRGHGEVWMGAKALAVRPGSFVLMPPGAVRSVRASATEPLEFYAVTTPAWNSDDDVLTTAPPGAPR